MAFPEDLTATLTGATRPQLYRWRKDELLVPEVSPERPPLYSFRDVVALRTVVHLRSEISLQRIKRAFATLSDFELTDHPSAYQFASDGKSIAVWTDEGFMDLVKNPGQVELFSLSQIFRPFTTHAGASVVDFQHPRENLSVDARLLGGWPAVIGTRVPYDVVARAVDGETLTADMVGDFYPGVTPEAARDALSFDEQVRELKRTA